MRNMGLKGIKRELPKSFYSLRSQTSYTFLLYARSDLMLP